MLLEGGSGSCALGRDLVGETVTTDSNERMGLRLNDVGEGTKRGRDEKERT